MNIRGGGLAGDAITLRDAFGSAGHNILNLSDGAVLTTTVEFKSAGSATINVDGRATVTLGPTWTSFASYTVNLHAGSTLVGRYDTSLNSNIQINGAKGAVFENDGNSTNYGSHAVINADVVGAGTFTDGISIATVGFLEFGRSVAATETVNVTGASWRGKATLAIDSPRDFHAAVNLNFGIIELKNIQSGSYSFHNDVLSLFSHGRVVDTLRLHNSTTDTSPGVPSTGIVPLTVERHGTDIVISTGTQSVYAGDPTLFNRG